jgi:hypothetical protein
MGADIRRNTSAALSKTWSDSDVDDMADPGPASLSMGKVKGFDIGSC